MTNAISTVTSDAVDHEVGPRELSGSECSLVAGGMLQDPWGEDELTGGSTYQPWLFEEEESGETIIVTAVVGNDGGGYCPSDSGWIPNFIEELFDGEKFFFNNNQFFDYVIKGANNTLCLYGHDGELVGGYVGVTSDQPHIMELTFTNDETSGEVSVSVGAGPVGGGSTSGTTGSGGGVTIFLGPVS